MLIDPSFKILINELIRITSTVIHHRRPQVGLQLTQCHPTNLRVSLRVLKSDRTGLTAVLRYRFTGPVRPVTGGNRLNSNPNSNKFKNSHTTSSDRFTGRFDRFTGRFDRFEIQKLPVWPVYRPVWPVYRPVWSVWLVGLNGPAHFFCFSFLI